MLALPTWPITNLGHQQGKHKETFSVPKEKQSNILSWLFAL